MPYMTGETKRNIVLFLLAILAAALVSMLTPPQFPTIGLSSLLYCSILLAWALTVYRRALQRAIRLCLEGIAAAFLALFLLRMLRYFIIPGGTALSRWLWYGYYLPFTAVPLLVFLSALCVGTSEAERPLRRWRWLCLLTAVLSLAVLTNDLHSWAFYTKGIHVTGRDYTYGWLYYAVVLHGAVLMLSAFIITLHRCRLSMCRQLAWAPLLSILPTALLLVLYALAGEAPSFHGHKLYNVQEVFCFGVIAFWEACVQIGLIPVNTGYGEIFDLSTVQASLAEADGTIVYHSRNALPLSEAEMAAAKDGPVSLGNHRVLRSAPVSGGALFWTEDHTAIDEMNGDLEEAAARIEEENELIQEENRILAEKARYETQNQLYNRIAYRVHDQLVRIDELLAAGTGDEAAFQRALAESTILGAYVKRRGNLTILAESTETISLRDILLALRESMEYMTLYGIECGVYGEGDAPLSAGAALLCYDIFEVVTEAALPDLREMMVNLSVPDGPQMTILMEAPTALPDFSRERGRLEAAHGTLSVDPTDDGVRVRLSFRKEAAE